MEGLYKVVGINDKLLTSIINNVQIVHGPYPDEYPCLLWTSKDSRIRFDDKRIQCARFVYHYIISPISPATRVHQTCQNKEEKICIQPHHLTIKSSDKESEEWQKRKRISDNRRNDLKRQKRLGGAPVIVDEPKDTPIGTWIEKIADSSSDIQTPVSSPIR